MCAKRKLLPRPRNNGTMTESGFWGGIRSALRQKSRWWKPIAEAKKLARRPYKGNNKRQKWEYLCSKCKKWHMGKNTNVDHIIPAGSLKCANDLPGFVERLFCEVKGLQVMCTTCHDAKTLKERKTKTKK
jgi:hypothetical protein